MKYLFVGWSHRTGWLIAECKDAAEAELMRVDWRKVHVNAGCRFCSAVKEAR